MNEKQKPLPRKIVWKRPPDRVREWLADASADRQRPVILAVVLTLAGIGLIEVASASSVESVAAGVNPYDLPLKQGMWTLAGVVLMLGLARLPVRYIRKLAWPMLIAAFIGLGLVFTPLGMTVNGNRNWLNLGGFTAQPSEFAKLALIVWAASVLSRKQKLLGQWMHAVIPLLPVGAVIMGLVALGHDLGTTLIIMMILAATLFYGSVPMKVFGVAAAASAVAALVLAATSGNRMGRISSWLGMGSAEDSQGLGYQALNGQYALASGGWFGVGLGQSRLKWNWIPEAHNDFIFTILGRNSALPAQCWSSVSSPYWQSPCSKPSPEPGMPSPASFRAASSPGSSDRPSSTSPWSADSFPLSASRCPSSLTAAPPWSPHLPEWA